MAGTGLNKNKKIKKKYKGKKNSITRSDLIDDVSKGLLTFEKAILNVAPHEEQRPAVDYIRGDRFWGFVG